MDRTVTQVSFRIHLEILIPKLSSERHILAENVAFWLSVYKKIATIGKIIIACREPLRIKSYCLPLQAIMDMDGAPLLMEGLERGGGGGVMIVGNEVVLDNVVVGTLAAAGSNDQMTKDENLLAGTGLATTNHFLGEKLIIYF